MSTRTRKFCPERTLFETHANDSFTFRTRCWCGRPRGGSRDIFRALWRRGREVCSPASRRGVPPRASAWARERRGREACSPASRQGIPSRASEWSRGGRAAKFSSVQVGVCEGAKRSEVCSPATCEVHFGSAARSAARRRDKFSQARAGGRGCAPAGEGAKGHDLQPGEVFGVSAALLGTLTALPSYKRGENGES